MNCVLNAHFVIFNQNEHCTFFYEKIHTNGGVFSVKWTHKKHTTGGEADAEKY